jgi:hypothetical protein
MAFYKSIGKRAILLRKEIPPPEPDNSPSDFALARRLGANTYPTLLLLDAHKVHRLAATGTARTVMKARLEQLLR